MSAQPPIIPTVTDIADDSWIARHLRGNWGIWLAVCVLIGGLGMTLLAGSNSRAGVQAARDERFQRLIDRLVVRVNLRLGTYEDALRGVRGVYVASTDVSRGEFGAYVRACGFDERYRGLHGLGFVRPVPRTGLEEFLARTRRDGAPEFVIEGGEGGHDELYIVEYFDSATEQQDLAGLDLAGIEACRAAADFAAETGIVALTAPVAVRSADGAGSTVFMLMPIYDGPGGGPPEASGRRAALLGWAIAPIDVAQTMLGITLATDFALDMRITDTTDAAAPHELTDTREHSPRAEWIRNPLTRTITLAIGGRSWTLDIDARPEFYTGADMAGLRGEMATGITASVMLAAIVLVLGRSNERARRIAREMSRAARLSEERWQLAIEASNNGTWDWDLRTNEVRFSPMWLKQLGLEPPDIRGELQDWSSRVHPEDLDLAIRAIQDYAEGRAETYSVEHRMRHKDGSWRWIHTQGVCTRDGQGRAIRMVGSHTDVTDRKMAMERLSTYADELLAAKNQLEAQKQEIELARDAADAANRAKSSFVANMSHEIRTPMTAILGYADLLLEPQDSPETARECGMIIKRNGEHLLSLLNDVLDLSKIEAGKMSVERIPVSPRQVVDDVAQLMRARAQSKGLALRVRHDNALPAALRLDPTRLRQILLNLVGNAVKFTQQGEVRIETWHDRNPARLRIAVSDTGIGVTPDQARRLFEPFMQADESMARRFGGTGLGLPVSIRLAELLGGGIDVQSTPGAGSTFTLSIDAPVAVSAADSRIGPRQSGDPEEPDEAPRAHSMSGRILFADDSSDNQRLISFHLRRAGARVELADNGQQAFDAVIAAASAGEPFELVLMDMQMPVMDGYSAVRRIREAGIGVPIIALTAHAMAQDRQRCLSAGCDDYITKPINRDQLLGVCGEWLELSRLRRVQSRAA